MVFSRGTGYAVMCFNNKSYVIWNLSDMYDKVIVLNFPDAKQSTLGSPSCVGESIFSVIGFNQILEIRPNELKS
jgi:hypothetical protein